MPITKDRLKLLKEIAFEERFISKKAYNKAREEYRKNYMAFDVPKHLTLDYCKHICMEFTNWTCWKGYEYPRYYYGENAPKYIDAYKNMVDFVVFLGPERYTDIVKGLPLSKPLAQIVFMQYYPLEKQKNWEKYTYDERVKDCKITETIEFKTVEEMIAHIEGFLASMSSLGKCFSGPTSIVIQLEDKYSADTKNINRIY